MLSESAFIRYPGADEIVRGSPRTCNNAGYEVLTWLWILAAMTVKAMDIALITIIN